MVAIATPIRADVANRGSTPVYAFIRDVAMAAALPKACYRVMEIADKQRAAAREMAEVITYDSTLGTQVLALINSPYLGLSTRFTSITQAVEVIGTRALRSICLTVGAMSALRVINTPLIDRRTFWQNGIHCGLLARALARVARHQQCDRLFTVGMLHAIGKLAMAYQDPKRMRRVQAQAATGGVLALSLEEQTFGFNYCHAGAALLETWQFAASMWMPIACQRYPAAATDFRTDAAIINIAQAVTATLPPTADPSTTIVRDEVQIEPIAWLQCGLGADVLTAALSEVDSLWSSVTKTLVGN